MVSEWGHKGYKVWAEEYYEQSLDDDALACIFDGKIDSGILSRLNPDLSMEDLTKDLKEIGIGS